MYDKHFAEFNGPEQKLKDEIFSVLESLNALEPDKWPRDLLQHADPSRSSQEILRGFMASLPEMAALESDLNSVEVIESLRITAIWLTAQLHKNHLEYLFIKQHYLTRSTFFLNLRYQLCVEILTKKLNQRLIYNSDKVSDILEDSIYSVGKFRKNLAVVKAAKEEIDRLFSADDGELYARMIFDFEAAIEQYIRDNFSELLVEAFLRLAVEGAINNLPALETKLQLSKAFSADDVKDIAEVIFRTLHKRTNQRLGRKRGGKREKQSFQWTEDRQLAFFQKMTSLPKIRKQSCWKFALSELIEQGFNAETISWLKSHKAFKTLPDNLFKEALKAWRKYLGQENWKQMKKEESPRAFEYRHAIYLLGYPESFTRATLETHYYKGRKLARNLQREI